jgi:hypothetical protein
MEESCTVDKIKAQVIWVAPESRISSEASK